MNLEDARARMLGQQIRAWEVLDARILDVLGRTPRELFVPEPYHDLAFADMEIPLSHGQQMMAPKVEGRLLQSLALQPDETVLEVGTGSGFLTACLSELAASVSSVDLFSDFTTAAREKLDKVGARNVDLRTEDAAALKPERQFDAIAVTGSVPDLNDHFIEMLRPGGRLFIIVGRAPVMDALLITRDDNGGWTSNSLFETLVPPLLNVASAEPFVL